MPDHPRFVVLANKTMSEPNAPHNFLPKYLGVVEGKLGWTAPSYAPFLDIPIAGEYLAASLIVSCTKLGEKVTLPPNLKRLSETPNLTEHQQVYIAQYRTSAATIEYIHQKKDPNCPTMKKIVKNWKKTCNKLVEDPHFGDG